MLREKQATEKKQTEEIYSWAITCTSAYAATAMHLRHFPLLKEQPSSIYLLESSPFNHCDKNIFLAQRI